MENFLKNPVKSFFEKYLFLRFAQIDSDFLTAKNNGIFWLVIKQNSVAVTLTDTLFL